MRLADQGVEMSGSYPLTALDRLIPLLDQIEGEVTFRLNFTRDTNEHRVVKGKISACLRLICQRCLMPTLFPIEREVLLGIVEDLMAAERIPANFEPLLVENSIISVREMVEDELILSLPVVATHEHGYCPTEDLLKRYTPREEGHSDEGPNPFGVLKSI
ncbi:23S rRNA accumulation protein YceD [Gammaproteobacteria bacterium]